MSVVSDVLETVLNLRGLSQYQTGFGAAEAVHRSFGNSLTDLERKSLAFGVAAGVTGLGVKFLGDTARAAAEDQANLSRAAGNFKGKFPADELSAYTDELRILTGVADDTTYGMLGLLGTFQVTKQQAKDLALPLLNATESLKAQGQTAESVAVQVGKAIQMGNAAGLQKSGIKLDNTAAFEAADQAGRVAMVAKALQDQGGDAAIRFRNTTLGATQAVVSAWGEVKEAIGGSLLGPMTGVLNTIARLEEGFLAMPDSAKTTASVIAVAVVGAMAAYTIGTGVAVVQTIKMTRELAALELQARKTAGAVNKVGSPTGNVPGTGGGRGGGIVGAIIGTLAAAGGESIHQSGENETGAGGALKRIGGRGIEGAGLGGASFGVQGALIGGILGLLEGSIEGIARGGGGAKKDAGKDPHLAELEKINANLQKQLDATKQLAASGGAGFATSDVPTVIQRVVTRGIRV